LRHWRRGAYRFVGGRKPEVKRPLGRPRHRWEDNIKMDLQKVEGGGTNLIDLAQNRDKRVGCWGCSNELLGSVKYTKLID
jgi:hypothetical protein